MTSQNKSHVIAMARERFLTKAESRPHYLLRMPSLGLAIPDWFDGRWFGAIVAQLHRDRIIERVSYVPSSNRCCHSALWAIGRRFQGGEVMSPADIEKLADALAERLAARGVAPSSDGLLDVHGAAALLDCSVPTVERLTKTGVVPSMKLGRLRRYRRADLLGLNGKGGGNE